MILHGIEYQRPTSLNMRIMADHVTYSFLAFMKSIFHFCLGCYCGGYSQNGRSNLSSFSPERYGDDPVNGNFQSIILSENIQTMGCYWWPINHAWPIFKGLEKLHLPAVHVLLKGTQAPTAFVGGYHPRIGHASGWPLLALINWYLIV